MKRLVPYDPNWASIYGAEAQMIAGLMGDGVCALHHIGSTAIPWLQAKPIIDILLEVSSLQAVDNCAALLGNLGYEARGEYGISGRRYFNKKPTKLEPAHFWQKCRRGFVSENAQNQSSRASIPTKSGSSFVDDALGFHLHAYLAGSFQIRRHLAFRDYLILKPELAAQYAALKAELSHEDGTLKPEYQRAKQPFVDAVALEALRFFEQSA